MKYHLVVAGAILCSLLPPFQLQISPNGTGAKLIDRLESSEGFGQLEEALDGECMETWRISSCDFDANSSYRPEME